MGEYTHSPLAHLQAKAVSNPGLTHSAEETETVRESVFFPLENPGGAVSRSDGRAAGPVMGHRGHGLRQHVR